MQTANAVKYRIGVMLKVIIRIIKIDYLEHVAFKKRIRKFGDFNNFMGSPYYFLEVIL